MGSRLHGNDGRNPQSSFPRTARIHGGGPAAMGSRLHGNDGRTHNRHSRHGGAAHPNRHSHGRRTHNRHSRHGANPRPNIVIPAQAGIHGGGPAAMGSRLHGNDGRTHNRHSRHGGPRRTHIVIPAHGGNPRPNIVIPAHGGNPRRGAGGDGFPSPRERPTIVIPAAARARWVHNRHSTGTTGGNRHSRSRNRHSRHGANPRRWGPADLGSRLHGNESGRRRRTAQSSFPPRRAAAHPNRHPTRRRESSPRERRAATGRTTQSSSRHGENPRPRIPAGIHGEGQVAMGSRLHGNGGRTHNRHSRHGRRIQAAPHRHSRAGGNPRRGAGGDGFPS